MLGAVYTAVGPLVEIVPTPPGLKDQVTSVFDAPVTVAVSVWVWEGFKVAETGVSDIPTAGLSVIVAAAAWVALATLVAITTTFCMLEIEAGAV